MTFEEIQRTKKIISESTILSQVEKVEWSQLLSSMNDSQVADLLKIIQPKQNPIPTAIKPVVTPLYKQVDITEKELSGTVPTEEKELPSPVPVKNITQAPQASGMPKPVSDPIELQKRVEQIVREMSSKNIPETEAPAPKRKLELPEDSRPQQDQNLVRKFETVRQATPKPVAPEEVQFRIPQDFEKLTPNMIHGKDPNVFLKKLFDSVVELAKKEKFYAILDYLDNSSLHQVYVEIGVAMLNDDSENRDAAYEKIIQSRKAKGQEILTRPEFEAMADFRSHIEKFFV